MNIFIHLEASALGSLIAACPAWKRREERDLYSPRMVGKIKERKKIETSNKKQWYDLTILTILTTVYNSVTITTKERRLAYTDIEIS